MDSSSALGPRNHAEKSAWRNKISSRADCASRTAGCEASRPAMFSAAWSRKRSQKEWVATFDSGSHFAELQALDGRLYLTGDLCCTRRLRHPLPMSLARAPLHPTVARWIVWAAATMHSRVPAPICSPKGPRSCKKPGCVLLAKRWWQTSPSTRAKAQGRNVRSPQLVVLLAFLAGLGAPPGPACPNGRAGSGYREVRHGAGGAYCLWQFRRRKGKVDAQIATVSGDSTDSGDIRRPLHKVFFQGVGILLI